MIRMHVCMWRCSGEYLLSESYQLQFRLNVVRILWGGFHSVLFFHMLCSLRESSLAEANYTLKIHGLRDVQAEP